MQSFCFATDRMGVALPLRNCKATKETVSFCTDAARTKFLFRVVRYNFYKVIVKDITRELHLSNPKVASTWVQRPAIPLRALLRVESTNYTSTWLVFAKATS